SHPRADTRRVVRAWLHRARPPERASCRGCRRERRARTVILAEVKIVCLVKQVPAPGAIEFDPDTQTLRREGVPLLLNPFDRYAVQHAVALREQGGGEVVVMTMGPPQAVSVSTLGERPSWSTRCTSTTTASARPARLRACSLCATSLLNAHRSGPRRSTKREAGSTRFWRSECPQRRPGKSRRMRPR